MAYSCEWVRKNLGKETPSEPYPCEWVKQHWEDEIWEAPYPCEAIEQYAESLRTVLYEDGTFIINERGADVGANVKKHGEAGYVYPPLDSEHDYAFARQEERYWVNESALIQSVEFGSSVQPTSMRTWFMYCPELESFDATNLDTSECTSLEKLFAHISSKPNTKLTTIDLSSLNTSKVETMKAMFQRCHALTDVNVGFNTSSVTNMDGVFGHCQSLVSIDVSTFDTSKVTTMTEMFKGCSSLTSLDLSNFDTSSVTTMYYMFRNCSALTSFDVSIFNTSNVTNMGAMFSGCSALTTIYASGSFVVEQVTNSVNMFDNCTSLVGGAGTTYDSTKRDKTYARIDNPPDAPGYFTEK